METSSIIVFLIIAAVLIYSFFDYQKKGIISKAKFHGILICGEHYKVYKIYRSSSYTDGGVYIKHHDVHDFGEMVLVSSDKREIYITESHLLYCLKVRKHNYKKQVEGKMTNKWAEWSIDNDGWDERGLANNDVYLSLF